jgi:hypothetical protein
MKVLGLDGLKKNALLCKRSQKPLLAEGREGVCPRQTTEKRHALIIRFGPKTPYF